MKIRNICGYAKNPTLVKNMKLPTYTEIQELAKHCNDPYHDPRWCMTCEIREDAMFELMRLIQGKE